MPYAVAAIAVLAFLAGVGVAGERYVLAGFLVAAASAVALWLRYWTLSTIHKAWEKGAGYGESTRYRLHHLPEAVTVPEKFAKKRFVTNGDS